MWLQAVDAYIDVRGEGSYAGGACFAGESVWREPRFTWRHDIELGPTTDKVDSATLLRDGVRLIERGDHLCGHPGPYTEVWLRVSEPGDVAVVVHTQGGLAVRIGRHAAAIIDRRPLNGVAARYQHRRNGAWHTELSSGSPSDLDALPVPHPSTGWEQHDAWRRQP
jgi:hypothetical protein